MFESIFYWVVSAFAIVGVWLNIKKKKYCFIIWTFTNACWMIIDFINGIYAQAFLFMVYFILSIKGFLDWRKEEQEGSNENK